MLSVLGTLLDVSTVLAAHHATDVTNSTGGLLGIVIEMTGLATTSHACDTLGSSEAFLSVSGTLLDLLVVRNPAGDVLCLAGPTGGLASTRVSGLSPVGLRGRGSTLEREELGSLKRAELNRSVGKRSIESSLKESGNILRLTISTNDDGTLNVDGQTFFLDLSSLGLGVDLLGSIFDSLSIDSVGMESVVAVAVVSVDTVAIIILAIVAMTVAMTVTGVRIVAMVSITVVSEVRQIRGELTMLIEERNTIGPHTVKLEVLANMDLVESSLDVVHHAVVVDGTRLLKVVHHLHELSTDLLEVVSSEAALLVESLEVDKVLSGIVNFVKESGLVLEVVLVEVGHAEGEVIDGRVEHLGDGGNEVLVVLVLVVMGGVVSVESGVGSRVEIGEISKMVNLDGGVISMARGDMVGSGVMDETLVEVVLVGAGVIHRGGMEGSSVMGVLNVVLESQVCHGNKFQILL